VQLTKYVALIGPNSLHKHFSEHVSWHELLIASLPRNPGSRSLFLQGGLAINMQS